MKVISLFDGCAVAYQALNELGITIDKYYASEVDKYAIFIAMKNHPDIIQLGDIKGIGNDRAVHTDVLGDIDLLIGGSPCQGFSFAGKQLNFEDKRSKLFFEFARLKNELNPKWFLLENVNMKKEYRDVISAYLGVEPININSNLVSAQNRNRWYWTNIPNVGQPKDRGILLKDIVHENADGWTDEDLVEYIIPYDKTLTILNTEVAKGKIGFLNNSDSQSNRVYHIHDKSVALCGQSGGLGAKTGLYLFGCITPDRVNKRQNGQRFSDGKKFYTLTAQDQHGILVEGYIRKLTPIECERLQTLPDNYSEGVSNSRRYKMLGNGFTCEVIKHILSNMEV